MEDTDISAPCYKPCLFLFGNVDKYGKLEDEYARDEDLASINYIDSANLDEVEATVMSLVADDSNNSSPVLNETSATCSDSLQSIEPIDYYNESELISFHEVENSVEVPQADEDEYDDHEALLESAKSVCSQSKVLLPSCIKLPSAPVSPVYIKTSSVDPSRSQSEPSSPIRPRPSTPSPKPNNVAETPSAVDNSTLIMPPPLHPAPRYSLQRNPSVNFELNGDVDLLTQQRCLNTPLGNLLPPEYANEDITKLYPHYSTNTIPMWGRIMNLPYPPRKFDHLKREPEWYLGNESSDTPANMNASIEDITSEGPHLIYNSLLDLGEIPTKKEQYEEAENHDDLRILQTSADPDENCLAGSNRSWWRVAFAKRLGEIERANEGSKNSSSTNAELGEKKTPKKSIGVSESTNRDMTTDTSATVDDTKSNGLEYKGKPKVLSFREGIAKFWYDLYDVPRDTDVEKWDGWLKNSLSLEGSEDEKQIPSFGELKAALPEFPYKIEFPEIPLKRIKEEAEEACDDEIFHTYELTRWEKEIIYDTQKYAKKQHASLIRNAADAGWVPSIECRTMASFMDTYQGICRGVLSSKVISGQQSATASAASAAHHATVSGVTGGVLQNTEGGVSQAPSTLRPSTVMSTSNSASTSNILFSIFPANVYPSLKDGSWGNAIIYDPELACEAIMKPHLLTLNKNDEDCLLDAVQNDDEIEAAMAQSTAKKNKPQHGQQDGSHVNKASFHVTFGYASTRGTLTGALAKAEKGAEKVKRILGKVGLLAEGEWNENKSDSGTEDANGTGEGGEDAANSDLASAAAAASGLPPKDPFNISNDEFYAVRSGGLSGSLARCGPLQHSNPAVELWPPFFPPQSSTQMLRQFHRVPMKVYTKGASSQYNVPIAVNNLTKLIQRKAKDREDEKLAAGGGDIFFMRTPQDLSGCDGDIVLFEYSEEFPPFLNQVGMATRLVNYYRPLVPKDPSLSPDPAGNSTPPDLPYGSLVNVGSTDSPFLGVIRPGGCLQSMENNMFRAPVFQHKTLPSDFLLIRNKNGLYIRKLPIAFTVGQVLPLMEVPGPNSKRANNFVRDFLTVYILRLFLKSKETPKRIKMEEIRSAFPYHSESTVRKRLKTCAEFKRTGIDASWWVLRPEYRMPSEEELRYLVSPEDYCAYASMQAAELRLKDAGYGEKSLFVLEENQEENEEGQPKMEDEVRAAPWNTTRAFLAAQRGGCFLELHGPADPTGCGEAFSYSKTSAKPGALFRLAGGEARGLLKHKNVTGTDADLRKLRLREAREMLRGFGISESELATFKRWEIIDMVRFTSTERAKQGEEEDTAKFARGNRLSMAEQIRCYREECQRIFDLQNRVLSNPELISTDEEDEEKSSEDEDEDGKHSKTTIGGIRISNLPSTQQSAKNVQSLLSNKITSAQLHQKQEEAEKEDLKRSVEFGKIMMKNKRKPTPQAAAASSMTVGPIEIPKPVKYKYGSESAGIVLDLPIPNPSLQKTVRITRVFRKGTPEESTQTETLPWSTQLEIYFKIIQSSNADQIQAFIGSDEEFKEQKRKEKRRLQDQMRRQRRQQQFLVSRGISGQGPLRDASGRLIPINRLPVAAGGGVVQTPVSSSRRKNKGGNYKMRCGACGQTGHMRTNKECPMYGRNDAIAPPIPGSGRSGSRRSGVDVLAAQDHKSRAAAQQIGGGPKYAPSISNDFREASSNAPAPRSIGHSRLSGDSDDEYDEDPFSRRDMDYPLEDSRVHDDVHNQPHDGFEGSVGKFKISRRVLEQVEPGTPRSHRGSRVSTTEKGGAGGGTARRRSTIPSAADDDYPTTAIKHRGNRRRIDPIVSINHIFEEIYKGLISIQGSKMFMHPVSKKDFPNYYNLIEHPMDLSQIRMKINNNVYQTRQEFMKDVNLIRENSEKFNGQHSSFTEIASKMLSFLLESFAQKENKLMRLEKLANPLMDSDSRVRLGFLLQQVVDIMQNFPNSRAFHLPVDKRRYTDYYVKIANPMDLDTLRQRCKANRYKNREEFMKDAELILSNCIQYNGQASNLTSIATNMLAAARNKLEEQRELLDVVEKDILDHLEDLEGGKAGEGDVAGDPRPSTSRSTWKRSKLEPSESYLPGDELSAPEKRPKITQEDLEEKSYTASPLTNYTHDEDYEEHRSEASRRNPLSPHGPSTFADEDSRFSSADRTSLGLAPEDSQVADALRLSSDSDDEDGDAYDQEGGELMAIDDTFIAATEISNQHHQYMPDLDDECANDGYQSHSMDGSHSQMSVDHTASGEEEEDVSNQSHHRVEFFIGSDEEYSSSR
nr:transcription initiation factor TFIID subunit 1 [Hymenolepis microstoma]